MMGKKITVERREEGIEIRHLCDPEPVLATPEVECRITYREGDEKAAIQALRRVYADLQHQITGMTPLLDPVLDDVED